MRPIFGTAALASLMLLAAPTSAATRAFLTKAIKGDNSEMTLGSIAARRGAGSGVRQFGRMLVRDHRRARADAVPVAQRHGVAVPTSLASEAAAERRKLAALRGRSFDREFARYMVEDHRKDIADFRKEARSGDPRDVRALAQQTLPALRHHLRMAEALARAR